MINELLNSWERRSHCQNNFGNAVPRRSRWKRSLFLKTLPFQFDALIVSLTVRRPVRRPRGSGSPADIRLINPLFYRLNPVCKRTNVHSGQYRSIANIADAEKRPLAIKHHNLCAGLETVVFRPCQEWSDFGPNERVLTVEVPVCGVKFHQNWVRIATVRDVTDRQTERQTDTQTRVNL